MKLSVHPHKAVAPLCIVAFLALFLGGCERKPTAEEIEAARSAQEARPAPTPVVAAADRMAEQARQAGRWLAAAVPGTHVIQLAAVKDATQAAVVMGSLKSATPQPVRVLHVVSRGTPVWVILAGEFPDRSTAQAALNKLPTAPAGPDMYRATPFLRTVGKLRNVVLPTG